MSDLISRQAAIDAMVRLQTEDIEMYGCAIPEGFDGDRAAEALKALPSVHPERETGRLTKENIGTIRIHMNSCKEKLCNQHRWKEAKEYQRIVDKLDKMMEFAKVSKESPKGKWLEREVHEAEEFYDIEEWQSAKCSVCGRYHTTPYMYYFSDYNFCPNCGADMRGEEDGKIS